MKLKIAALLATVVVSASAFAQTAPAEPESTLSYNVGAVTDYRYRGISQTRLGAALQGGADYAHKSGFYVGTWASTIRWIKDTAPGLKGPLEVDLYGGYKGAINDTFSFDVGGLEYWYPSNNLKNNSGSVNANTFELYGAVTGGPVTVKYSRSLTTLFGFANSKGSGYLDVSATFDLGSGYSLVPHVGRQKVANNAASSYTDYSLTLGKDFGNGLSATAGLVTTNANVSAYQTPTGKFTGKSGLVAGVKYSF